MRFASGGETKFDGEFSISAGCGNIKTPSIFCKTQYRV